MTKQVYKKEDGLYAAILLNFETLVTDFNSLFTLNKEATQEIIEILYNYKELGVVKYYSNEDYYPTFLLANEDIIVISG